MHLIPGEKLPVTYTIDPKLRLVITLASDPATEKDVLEHDEKLRSDPNFDPSFRQLAEFSEVSEILVSSNLIKRTAHDQFFTPGVRRAFIANDGAVFGMARMYALHAESLGQVIEVFRDRGSAEAWLGL